MLSEQRAFVEIQPPIPEAIPTEEPSSDQVLVEMMGNLLIAGGWNDSISEGFHSKAGSETDFYSFFKNDLYAHLYISSEGKYITFSSSLAGYRFSYFDGSVRRIMEADENGYRFQDDKLTGNESSWETFSGKEALERGFDLIEQIGEHLPHHSTFA